MVVINEMILSRPTFIAKYADHLKKGVVPPRRIISSQSLLEKEIIANELKKQQDMLKLRKSLGATPKYVYNFMRFLRQTEDHLTEIMGNNKKINKVHDIVKDITGKTIPKFTWSEMQPEKKHLNSEENIEQAVKEIFGNQVAPEIPARDICRSESQEHLNQIEPWNYWLEEDEHNENSKRKNNNSNNINYSKNSKNTGNPLSTLEEKYEILNKDGEIDYVQLSSLSESGTTFSSTGTPLQCTPNGMTNRNKDNKRKSYSPKKSNIRNKGGYEAIKPKVDTSFTKSRTSRRIKPISNSNTKNSKLEVQEKKKFNIRKSENLKDLKEKFSRQQKVNSFSQKSSQSPHSMLCVGKEQLILRKNDVRKHLPPKQVSAPSNKSSFQKQNRNLMQKPQQSQLKRQQLSAALTTVTAMSSILPSKSSNNSKESVNKITKTKVIKPPTTPEERKPSSAKISTSSIVAELSARNYFINIENEKDSNEDIITKMMARDESLPIHNCENHFKVSAKNQILKDKQMIRMPVSVINIGL